MGVLIEDSGEAAGDGIMQDVLPVGQLPLASAQQRRRLRLVEQGEEGPANGRGCISQRLGVQNGLWRRHAPQSTQSTHSWGGQGDTGQDAQQVCRWLAESELATEQATHLT